MTINEFRKKQIITFTVTWIIYASSYLLRKPLGVVSELYFVFLNNKIYEDLSQSGPANFIKNLWPSNTVIGLRVRS